MGAGAGGHAGAVRQPRPAAAGHRVVPPASAPDALVEYQTRQEARAPDCLDALRSSLEAGRLSWVWHKNLLTIVHHSAPCIDPTDNIVLSMLSRDEWHCLLCRR